MVVEVFVFCLFFFFHIVYKTKNCFIQIYIRVLFYNSIYISIDLAFSPTPACCGFGIQFTRGIPFISLLYISYSRGGGGDWRAGAGGGRGGDVDHNGSVKIGLFSTVRMKIFLSINLAELLATGMDNQKVVMVCSFRA
jgi:hypothetical protein